MIKNQSNTVLSPESPRKKTVIIALPGREFSGNFLVSWTNAIIALLKANYEVVVVNRFSSYVTFSRMLCLGLDVLRGIEQKPFNGEIDYDVWVTIDSDIIFTPEQLFTLILSTIAHPVVSGFYRMADMKHVATVQVWDTSFYAHNGTFKFLTPEDIESYKSTTGQTFMPVAYTGMGMFACRREVLDKLRYPYFDAPLFEITKEDGTVLRDICSEDVSFCRNIEAAGYTIMLHTGLRVGHEKMLVI